MVNNGLGEIAGCDATNILIVVDNNVMRAKLLNDIEDFCYKVRSAANSDEAVIILQEDDSIDLMLLDYGIFDELSNLNACDIPIIIIVDNEVQADEAINDDGFYYITKPIDNNKLKRIMKAAEEYIQARVRCSDNKKTVPMHSFREGL